MDTNLLQTKLYIPTRRPNLVPRLTKKLEAGLNGKLTLISAPAGFGKTTLITEWVHNVPFCWLSLDKSDNNLVRFLTYFVEAMQTAVSDFGQQLQITLQSAKPLNSDTLLTMLVNNIAQLKSNIIFVLDDYHLIETEAIQHAIAFLLDHIPPQLHLVLTTRSDPPLPLSRLRARGQMAEIREADLRFTVEETAVFLNNTMNLTLSAETVAALEARTEGWITGLQMAALSMQGRDDIATFVTAFTGSHRYILDYLTEEVLEQQPSDIQEFLLETAVLNRLCADLCQAVTQNNTCQAMLETVAATNLFIISLDDERRWYRYHHLFADLLQNRLQRTNPDQLPILHQRAADWYTTHNAPREAVHHALAAKDYPLTGRIVQDNWRRLFHQGWISTTLNWLNALPPDLMRRLPPLSIATCWSLSVRGEYGRIPHYLSQAEHAFKTLVADGTLPESQPEYLMLKGQFYLLSSLIARTKGDTATAIQQAQKALSEITQVGAAFADLAIGAATIQLGYGYLAAGDEEQAAHYFNQSRQHARQSENFIAMCTSAFELTRIWQKAGRLADAEAICREALALAEQPTYAAFPAFFIVHIGLADLLRATGRLDEAKPHLQQGLDLGRRSGHVLYLAHGYLVAERLYLAQNRATKAHAARQQAQQLLNQAGLTVTDLHLAETAVSPSPPTHLLDPLTPREQDVLRLIAAGLSNREIGTELHLSLNTIKTHSKTLYSKLDVHTRTQAVNKARALGLLGL